MKEQSKGPPPLPEDWGRCHAYMDRKKRYCRQMPSTGSIYCGNHLNLGLDSDMICPATGSREGGEGREGGGACTNNGAKRPRLSGLSTLGKGKRIPCPLDPSHTIYESNLNAHLNKCNKAKQRINDRAKVYYRHGLNQGGFGLLRNKNDNKNHDDGSINDNDNDDELQSSEKSDGGEKDAQYYQNLAVAILRTYHYIFIKDSTRTVSYNSRNSNHNDDGEKSKDDMRYLLHDITKEELYSHIPYQNYYLDEKENGLEDSLSQHRIKIGGPKHMEQIGSIVGHVRDMIHCDNTNNGDNNNGNMEKEEVSTIIEMGAGRATTGFVVASVIANTNTNTTIAQNSSADDTVQSNRNNAANQDDNANQSSIKEKSQKNKGVKLILVERSGTRGKADRAFRRGQRYKKHNINDKNNYDKEQPIDSSSNDDALAVVGKEGENQSTASHRQKENQGTSNDGGQYKTAYMDVNKVEVQRIKCDLAHVHLPSVLAMENDNHSIDKDGGIKEEAHDTASSSFDSHPPDRRDILVIAKHCCGCGTDLALKSLMPIKQRIQGVILTTCCHGVCNWKDFVGRDYLHSTMVKANESHIDSFQFGEEEFNLMKRWACGTVIGLAGNEKVKKKKVTHQTKSNDDDDGGEDDNEQQTHHLRKEEVDHDNMKNITYIVKSMDLSCGLEGLGRACQRLIDYGRTQFMQEHLFDCRGTKLEKNQSFLCHYVDSGVTPQNALLKGNFRSVKK